MQIRVRMAGLIAGMILSACAQEYPVPEIEGGTSFSGVRDFIGSDKRVRIVLTHGMCSHLHRWYDPYNWVGRRVANLAEALGIDGLTIPDTYAETASFPAYLPVDQRIVRRFDVPLTDPNGVRYDVTFFTFGEGVDKARAALKYENGRGDGYPGKPRRASVNAALKTELMNRCLIDAVVYLGSSGDMIRAAMREGFCGYLGGRIGRENSGAVGHRPTCSNLRRSGVPVVLVPESLGSKVLFDAYNDIEDGTSSARKSEALGPIAAIHLVSNQIPLLQQATARRRPERRSARPALTQFLEDIALPAAAATRAREIPIVAYSDPNDLFSYRLTADVIPGGGRFRLVNVLTSNAPTYLGLYEDLLVAHQGYERLRVFSMVLDGLGAAGN